MSRREGSDLGTSRRAWLRMALHGVAGGVVSGCVFSACGERRFDSPVNGVRLGVQSHSFRDLDFEHMFIALDGHLHFASCELWQGHVEPGQILPFDGLQSHVAARGGKGLDRDTIRKWRSNVPTAHFHSVRKYFDVRGIALSAYNLNFRNDFTDEEIRRGFEMARLLGVSVITASADQRVISRIAPWAERFKIVVGLHNHSTVDPNEFTTPDDLTRALALSPWLAACLDIGHFTAADFDAVSFLTMHHDRIVSLRIKDRKRKGGPNVPFGRGDTPIREVLRLVRDNRWSIPANIDYEYAGGDAVSEVAQCLAYCRRTLES